jgi:hypothetical protein
MKHIKTWFTNIALSFFEHKFALFSLKHAIENANAL